MKNWFSIRNNPFGTQRRNHPLAHTTMTKNFHLRRALAALSCLLTSLTVAAQAAPDQNVLIKLLRDEASAYEHGDGVERDGVRAADLYCKAARMGDAESQFNLGWLYTNGRGVERSEATDRKSVV